VSDLKKSLQRMRVRLGYGYTAIVIVFSKPSSLITLVAGFLIAALGEAIRCWASGYIVKLDRMTVDGPYATCRHPLYLGSLILGTGVGLASGRRSLLYGYWLFFALVYPVTMLAEETELEEKFGGEFLEYRAKVPALIPRAAPENIDVTSDFSFSQFIKNREYKGVIAVVLAFFLLYMKNRLINTAEA
jgi:hypothetical protein